MKRIRRAGLLACLLFVAACGGDSPTAPEPPPEPPAPSLTGHWRGTADFPSTPPISIDAELDLHDLAGVISGGGTFHIIVSGYSLPFTAKLLSGERSDYGAVLMSVEARYDSELYVFSYSGLLGAGDNIIEGRITAPSRLTTTLDLRRRP